MFNLGKARQIRRKARAHSERLLAHYHGDDARPDCSNCDHRDKHTDDPGHCSMFIDKPTKVRPEIQPCGQWKFSFGRYVYDRAQQIGQGDNVANGS